jgi:hypothetical protein
MTNKLIIARNLYLFQQLKEIALYRIPIILLKGIALIEAVPEYSAERSMEDIDLLVHTEDMLHLRRMLGRDGYLPVPFDPGALYHPDKTGSVDIVDHLWYLNKDEQKMLWDSAQPTTIAPHVYRLSADEMYLHILAHGAIHHASKEARWLRDLSVIKENREILLDECALEEKLKIRGLSNVARYYLGNETAPYWYRRILQWQHPLKGHFTRFLLLAFRKKLSYLWDALFPSAEFIRHRYNAYTPFCLLFCRLFRPLILLYQLAATLISSQLTVIFRCFEGLVENK